MGWSTRWGHSCSVDPWRLWKRGANETYQWRGQCHFCQCCQRIWYSFCVFMFVWSISWFLLGICDIPSLTHPLKLFETAPAHSMDQIETMLCVVFIQKIRERQRGVSWVFPIFSREFVIVWGFKLAQWNFSISVGFLLCDWLDSKVYFPNILFSVAGVPKFILISVHDYNLPSFLLNSGYFTGKRQAESELLSKYPTSGTVRKKKWIPRMNLQFISLKGHIPCWACMWSYKPIAVHKRKHTELV